MLVIFIRSKHFSGKATKETKYQWSLKIYDEDHSIIPLWGMQTTS